jgi:hypothetical protein
LKSRRAQPHTRATDKSRQKENSTGVRSVFVHLAAVHLDVVRLARREPENKNVVRRIRRPLRRLKIARGAREEYR